MPRTLLFYLSLGSNKETLTSWPLMNTWKALISWSVFVRCANSDVCPLHAVWVICMCVCMYTRVCICGVSRHCHGHSYFENPDFAQILTRTSVLDKHHTAHLNLLWTSWMGCALSLCWSKQFLKNLNRRNNWYKEIWNWVSEMSCYLEVLL